MRNYIQDILHLAKAGCKLGRALMMEHQEEIKGICLGCRVLADLNLARLFLKAAKRKQVLRAACFAFALGMSIEDYLHALAFSFNGDDDEDDDRGDEDDHAPNPGGPGGLSQEEKLKLLRFAAQKSTFFPLSFLRDLPHEGS